MRGQVAKVEAPLGYANVSAHAMFHRENVSKQQAVVPTLGGFLRTPRDSNDDAGSGGWTEL